MQTVKQWLYANVNKELADAVYNDSAIKHLPWDQPVDSVAAVVRALVIKVIERMKIDKLKELEYFKLAVTIAAYNRLAGNVELARRWDTQVDIYHNMPHLEGFDLAAIESDIRQSTHTLHTMVEVYR